MGTRCQASRAARAMADGSRVCCCGVGWTLPPVSIGGTRRYYARLICLKGIHHPSVPRAALLMWSTCVPDLLDGLGFVEGGREGGGGQTAAYLYKITGPSRGPCLSFFLSLSRSRRQHEMFFSFTLPMGRLYFPWSVRATPPRNVRCGRTAGGNAKTATANFGDAHHSCAPPRPSLSGQPLTKMWTKGRTARREKGGRRPGSRGLGVLPAYAMWGGGI